MSMPFSNIVKAQITQSLIKTLFEHAGYRVTRLGVEELFTEVVHLEYEQYEKLKLPTALRSLPDLLAADHEMNTAYLLEVKYRSTFNERTMQDLYEELSHQREIWESSYAILILGDPFYDGGKFHQDYIRVIPPKKEGVLMAMDKRHKFHELYKEKGCEGIWKSLNGLYDLSPKFDLKAGVLYKDADMITATIADLKKI